MMDNLEIEVKYHVTDMTEMRQRILALGATPGESHFETNIRFEDRHHSLIQRRSLLRLRQDKTATLTFKGEPDMPDTRESGQYKIHREIETTVSDFNATRQILEAVGFFPAQVYEKHRETFRHEGAVICLDTMPYGNFLEIEGNRENIRPLSDGLGFAWENRILANYLEMFEFIKNEHNLGFTDVTFENFKDAAVDLPALLERFQAT
ncbi:MAG: class IV adenylate cyclase [Thermodesulfobacteriota bacterium]|nr:class IV adenylate cyclase [Thermodesulfobacteriota bacterium]